MGKYDLTSQLTPVQSTFVDPGVQTFKDAAAIYRKTYDQNKDAYNLSKRVMAQMELMPGDEDAGLRDQFTGTINQTFEDIIKVGNFEDAEMAVQNAVDYITTDKTVLQARKNSAEFQKEEALIEQFGPSGILDFNKDMRSSFKTITEDEEGNQTVNSYREKMEQKEDYFTQMDNMTKGIAPDGNTWGYHMSKLSSSYMYGNKKGVGQAKVERIVDGLYDAYVGDKVGDQDFRRLIEIEGMTEQSAKEDIIRRMTNVAMKQEGITRTVSGIKDTTPASGPNGPGPGAYTQLHTLLQSTEKQDLGLQTFKTMVDGVDGSTTGSIKYSQDGLVLNYASQFSDSQLTNISQGLIDADLAANKDAAIAMIAPTIEFQALYAAGDEEGAFNVAKELGFMNDAEGWNINKANALNNVADGIGQVVGPETLQNMGALITAKNIEGDFVLNTGGDPNIQTVGTSFLADGVYKFNREQMDALADKMGMGRIGANFVFGIDQGATDIDNMEMNGQKMFVPMNDPATDTEYWILDGKYKTPFDANKEARVYNVDHTQSDYNDNDGALALSSGHTVKMISLGKRAFTDFANEVNIMPGIGNKASLKDMFTVEQEALVRSVNLEYGHLGSAVPKIYEIKLQAVQQAIIKAANDGNTQQENINTYIKQALIQADQYISLQLGAGQ